MRDLHSEAHGVERLYSLHEYIAFSTFREKGMMA